MAEVLCCLCALWLVMGFPSCQCLLPLQAAFVLNTTLSWAHCECQHNPFQLQNVCVAWDEEVSFFLFFFFWETCVSKKSKIGFGSGAMNDVVEQAE